MEWIAKQMLRDVRKCGYHGRAVFRTDGEPARSVEDMIRTHKLALEEYVGEVLKVDTAAMAWLIEHCADMEKMAGRRTRGCAEGSSVDLCWSSGRR